MNRSEVEGQKTFNQGTIEKINNGLSPVAQTLAVAEYKIIK